MLKKKEEKERASAEKEELDDKTKELVKFLSEIMDEIYGITKEFRDIYNDFVAANGCEGLEPSDIMMIIIVELSDIESMDDKGIKEYIFNKYGELSQEDIVTYEISCYEAQIKGFNEALDFKEYENTTTLFTDEVTPDKTITDAKTYYKAKSFDKLEISIESSQNLCVLALIHLLLSGYKEGTDKCIHLLNAYVCMDKASDIFELLEPAQEGLYAPEQVDLYGLHFVMANCDYNVTSSLMLELYITEFQEFQEFKELDPVVWMQSSVVFLKVTS